MTVIFSINDMLNFLSVSNDKAYLALVHFYKRYDCDPCGPDISIFCRCKEAPIPEVLVNDDLPASFTLSCRDFNLWSLSVIPYSELWLHKVPNWKSYGPCFSSDYHGAKNNSRPEMCLCLCLKTKLNKL